MKVPINEADQQMLVLVPGIDLELSGRILSERDKLPFRKAEDMANRVEGIDLKTADNYFIYHRKKRTDLTHSRKSEFLNRETQFNTIQTQDPNIDDQDCRRVQGIILALFRETSEQLLKDYSLLDLAVAGSHTAACPACAVLYNQEQSFYRENCPN